MSDLLAAAGLTPVDAENNPVAAPAPAVTPPAPSTPAPAPVAIPEPPAADEPIVVPEGARNPDAVQNAIAAERKAARDAYARARELEAQLAAEREAALPLETRLAHADERAQEAERRALRLEVGLKHSLPVELVDRLRGNTQEEMETDVQSLLSLIKPAAPAPAVTAGGGFQPAPPVQADPAKAHNQLLANLLTGRRPGA